MKSARERFIDAARLTNEVLGIIRLNGVGSEFEAEGLATLGPIVLQYALQVVDVEEQEAEQEALEREVFTPKVDTRMH